MPKSIGNYPVLCFQKCEIFLKSYFSSLTKFKFAAPWLHGALGKELEWVLKKKNCLIYNQTHFVLVFGICVYITTEDKMYDKSGR